MNTQPQGKSAHPRQQHQTQPQPNYSPYESHAQSGSYPESPYHGNQTYKPTNQNYQNYQNMYQGQGNPYQQSMDPSSMQGLTNMMGNFQPYGNQNYSGYQGGAGGQGQHRGER